MKKSRIIFVLIVLVIPFLFRTSEADAKSIKISDKNFPDYYFMVYVKNNYDTDDDGKLSEKERNVVTEIDVGRLSGYRWDLEYPAPDTVKGIEFFPNLEKLDCSGGSIRNLDVSENTKLIELRCEQNSIKKLNLKKNTKLEVLYCYENMMVELNLSANKKLVELCCSENRIREIDLSKNRRLAKVVVSDNKLKKIDVTGLKSLETLCCDENKIKSLNVKKNKKLVTLGCSSNGLTSLNLKNNKNLDWLDCTGNHLRCLDLKKNKLIERIQCENNQLITGSLKLAYSQLERVEASTQKATIRCKKIGKHYYIPLSGVLKTNEITNLSYGKITEKGIRVNKKNLPKKITYEYNMFTDGDYMTKVTIKVKKK